MSPHAAFMAAPIESHITGFSSSIQNVEYITTRAAKASTADFATR
jgi:hypothetical protein